MKEIFKPVPKFETALINQDGTIFYYQDRQMKITARPVKKTCKKYKRVYINCKPFK